MTVAATAVGLTAGSAVAAPRVVSVDFDGPVVTGKETRLAVRAVDSAAAVNGMSVAFSRPAQLFALSACRPAGSNGRSPGGPFAPGAPVTLRAPHRFSQPGPQAVLVRIDSGGCDTQRQGGSVYQPITVTPTRPGQPAVPPVIGPPVTIPELLPSGPGLPGLPDVPGLPDEPDPTDLPGLPGVPALPPVPGLPGVPDLPDLPDLPGLPVLASSRAEAGLLATAAARCRGASRVVRPNRRSNRAARRALLCSMNSVRRRARVRRLRASRRLHSAASAYSNSMVTRGFFSHTAPGGVVLTTRLRRARYLPARRWIVGENLGSGSGRYGTPISILRAWLRSPPHRANLLERSFREVGLGLVSGQPGRSRRKGATYTANFGFRR